MKRTLLCAAVLLFVGTFFGQMRDTTLTKEHYENKSRTQKTVGWVMLSGGVALETVALIIGTQEVKTDVNNFFRGTAPGNNGSASAILGVAGLGAALGSIPFFISSVKNGQKASISFSNQKVLLPQQNGFATITRPAISLQIKL